MHTFVLSQVARFMGLHGAQLGPTGPRWAPFWPNEPCYQGCSDFLCLHYRSILPISPWSFSCHQGNITIVQTSVKQPPKIWKNKSHKSHDEKTATKQSKHKRWHISCRRHQMETLSALLALCTGDSPVSGEFPEGQWRGVLMFSLICAWINAWVNNVRLVIWDVIEPIMTSL